MEAQWSTNMKELRGGGGNKNKKKEKKQSPGGGGGGLQYEKNGDARQKLWE